MNIEKIKNWKRQGEVATLFTVATLVLMAAGTFLGAQQIVQNNILKLGSFAYNNTYRAHFYTGPTFQDKDTIPGQPNSGYTLIRGSLCFTGATIPSQLQRFWVHTPKDPNQGYPKKACDNTNADPKDDCIVYEGKTVEYIAPQTSRPYCDSPDVGKANWRAWDFTLKLQAPYTNALCSGLFVSSSSSFMFKDPIEMDMNSWHNFLKGKGVDCGPTPTVANTPVPTDKPVLTEFPTIKVPTARPTIDTRVSPGPFVTAIILPTDTQRCPDPKKPCPSITPVGDCRGDIRCSKANPCPAGYACLHAKNDPLQIGVCQSLNPKCNPSVTPTRAISQAPTNSPAQAKIRGEIVVNSCKKPDSVSTIICEKNNPARCIDTAGPVSFIGQDPVNPNKWIYSYEHLQAPGANGGMEPVVTNAFYENMQAFAQYTSTGLIREPGRVSFPAAQLGNIRANATIPTGQTEAVINYEVPQNNIVCPPVTPSSVPPTVNPSPMACNYSAIVEVIDEATGLPVPVSQMGDASKWGVANDKQSPRPRTLFSAQGDIVGGERVSRYKFETDRLTFRPADTNALYTKGEKAQVNLFIDTNKWQITGKIPCRGSKGCPFPNEPITVGRNLDQYGSKVDGFAFDCGTQVTVYGWKVKQLPPSSPENPGQPGQPAGQCVLRDPVNAVKCSPKNVKAVRKSTSTVAVSWTAPDASCNFTPGSNGDYYRVDLIDMTENPRAVITTCDKITSTSKECTLSPAYHPNSKGTKGNFQAGHNYVASVYAFKEIPGSVDMCVSNNGNASFDRPAKDNGTGDSPEPTTAPIGGGEGKDKELLTRQLDWMVNNVGVCWAGWSAGKCNLAYNGTNKWAQSVTDGRFKCYAPYGANEAVPGQETVVIGLMKGVGQINGIQTKRVDCIGNKANACIAAKDTNISQCESDLAVASTTNGQSIELKPNECWSLNANLGVTKLSSCPEDPKDASNQPPPRSPGQPQPTTQPGTGGSQTPIGTQVRGKVEIYTDAETKFEESDLRVTYVNTEDNITKPAKITNFSEGSFEYVIDDFDENADDYAFTVYVAYTIRGDGNIRRAEASRQVSKSQYKTKGIWDMDITLDPQKDPIPPVADLTPPVDPGENGTRPTPEPFKGTVKIKRTLPNPAIDLIDLVETDISITYDPQSEEKKSDINLNSTDTEFQYTIDDFDANGTTQYSLLGTMHYYYIKNGNSRPLKCGAQFTHEFNEADLARMNFTLILNPNRECGTPSSLLSTISLRNNSSSAIKSVSIAACDSSNKCSSNTVPLQLAAGASTKFKPTFSVPSTTRRLSCVINYTNGTSKQCPQQLITSDGGLQFTITAQSNNSVQTSVVDPLKVADTNRDCKVTSADATGLRDLDGSGTVNASDTSLFFSFLGQNACK